jgi:hypothetical protein
VLACGWHFCGALLRCLDPFSLHGINSMVVDTLNKSKLLYSAFWFYFFWLGRERHDERNYISNS